MPADALADFGRLVETHYQAVVAVAYASTRDVGLAEDIAQDTFLTAWDARAKLRDAAKVRPWLCSIARNKSRNALRDRKREVAEEHDMADPKPSVVDGAVAREATAELHAALAEVPLTYREPLVLFYWEQKSIAQVASALAITEEAAQKRISRGRSYLRDGLEAPLEGASRGRRTAAAAAAAVLAILATRTAAEAAAATKGAGISIFKLAGFVGLAGLVVGTVAVVRGRASDAAAREVVVARAGATPTKPAVPPVLEPALEPALDPAGGGFPAGKLPTPTGYQLTVLGPTNVAVDLKGGRSDVFLPEPPPAPAFQRHVTGRVRDAAGAPVANAAVVVGARLDVHMGSLSGAAGALTRADGTFEIVTHEEAAGFAIAMHPRGWSSVVAVPGGKSDAEIALVTPAPGALAIHVRQAGASREGQVMVRSAGLTLMLDTDARGDLAIPLLAPGTYQVKTWGAQMMAGGISAPESTEATVVAGQTTDVRISLPTGVLVVASAWKPGMSTVEYFLYAGTEKLGLAEMKQRGRAGTAMEYLLGGQDADRAAELHDVAPGEYTLCVDATDAEDQHLPLACKPVTVPADRATIEVTVDVATSSTR